MYGRYSKISNTSYLPKRPRHTAQTRLLLRSSLTRVFSVCYSAKEFVNTSPDNCAIKNYFLISQNICCVYSKELFQWDGSFEHPKHTKKMMGKKIYLHIYAQKMCLSWPMNSEHFISELKEKSVGNLRIIYLLSPTDPNTINKPIFKIMGIDGRNVFPKNSL